MSVVELPRIGEWEKKCWGVTRCLSHNHLHSAHELRTLTGWQCSRHYHRMRANSFYVDSGALLIRQYDDASDSQCTIVRAGQTCSVPSGTWHRFIVLEGGTAFEFYYPDRPGGVVSLDDIERDPAELGGQVDEAWFTETVAEYRERGLI